MSKNKIAVLFSLVLAVVILMGCGEKKDTTTTDSKTAGDKTKVTDTVKTTQTQTTQTTKKDTVMTDNTKVSKDDGKNSTGKYAVIETNMGKIKIKLYTEEAPITTANFQKLISEGFYNGQIFHRIIADFMIQGGDPTGTGTGGSKTSIPDEFGKGLKHTKKGLLSMANRGPNTGTSQFFITLAATPWLDGKHAIFGEVVDGMDVVEKMGKVKTGPNDKPIEDVKLIKATLTDK